MLKEEDLAQDVLLAKQDPSLKRDRMTNRRWFTGPKSNTKKGKLRFLKRKSLKLPRKNSQNIARRVKLQLKKRKRLKKARMSKEEKISEEEMIDKETKEANQEASPKVEKTMKERSHLHTKSIFMETGEDLKKKKL